MTNTFQTFEYKIKDESICIESCISEGTIVDIPETIEGYPVVEIASYAFSTSGNTISNRLAGERLEEIILPRTVKKIGRYAFYNCQNLKKLSFYNTLTDLGPGAFTGCHKVKEIQVTFLENKQSILREFLIELPEEQMVTMYFKDGCAKMLFPEFFEESIENTPARNLEVFTHGSGMLYRNCFVKKELSFLLYDERFGWARGKEFPETLFELVFQRLLFPYQLSEKAEKKYLEFLKEYLEKCTKWAVENEREKELFFLADHFNEEVQHLDQMISLVGKKGNPAILSYLMDKKHQRFKVKRKVFEL